MQFGEGLLEDLILPAIEEEGFGEGGNGRGIMFDNVGMVSGMNPSDYHITCRICEILQL